MEIAQTHYVNGNAVMPPYPEGCLELIIGMGCFWGAEKLFWHLEGVYSTSVGYTGGSKKEPTYKEVCTGKTGHAEAVMVIYQPEKISIDTLLKVFWQGHDPTQYMRQGHDVGTQYRSAIFYSDQATREIIDSTKDEYQLNLSDSGFGEIVTEMLPIQTFYYAEDYHQQYLAKNPDGYCGLGGCGVTFKTST